MKVGMRLPNYARWFRGDGIWATCEKGKEIGLDALFFVDHIMFTPHQYVGYGNGYMDIWTAMSYVAAITNIQGWKPILSQSVCVVPYRPPIQLAKIAATVDSLSGGRVMIGAGSGYNENEFLALGLDIRERGNMTDENLPCCKELWTNPVASFHGKWVNFDEMTISVRPVQQPIPILYGAAGPRPFRRIAERYQGWVAGGAQTPEAAKTSEQSWAEITRLWKEHGREGKPYWAVSGATAHLTMDTREAGSSIRKGLDSPNLGNPETVTLPGGHTYQRFAEGTERTYATNFRMTHPDDLVRQIRTLNDLGADMFVVNLPSYRYKDMDNLGLQLQQMELLAEHVLPKVPKS
ncbi:MAG: TIGR03619 family F420-dependent LLM class oxidoreductase [Chloroflexota bacterium]